MIYIRSSEDIPDCPYCKWKLIIASTAYIWGAFLTCLNPLCIYDKATSYKIKTSSENIPKCPRCELKMKLRNNNSGKHFRWCSNYPNCRGTREF